MISTKNPDNIPYKLIPMHTMQFELISINSFLSIYNNLNFFFFGLSCNIESMGYHLDIFKISIGTLYFVESIESGKIYD